MTKCSNRALRISVITVDDRSLDISTFPISAPIADERGVTFICYIFSYNEHPMAVKFIRKLDFQYTRF